MRKKILSSAMALMLAGIMGISSITTCAMEMESMPTQESEQPKRESDNTELEKEIEVEESNEKQQETIIEETDKLTTEADKEGEEQEDTIESDEVETEFQEETELEVELETEMPEETNSFMIPTEITNAPDASPLIVTENVPGTASGKRLTYTEVYNNSDATIDFGEYTFYYQYPSGGGRVWNTGRMDIEPGQTIVLWQCDDSKYNAGQDVNFFNEYYGTNLIEGKDIFRINYTGIHSTANRGFAFGRDERSIIAYAETNVDGVDLTDLNAKQSVHYRYSGHGTTSYKALVANATPGSVENWQVPSALVHYEKTPEISIEEINGPERLDENATELAVTAKVYGNQGITKCYLHYSQGENTNEKVMEMMQDEGSNILKASISKSELWGEEVSWYIEATYGNNYKTQSQKQKTTIGVSEETGGGGPFLITEVVTPPISKGEYAGNNQFSYVELYNRTTSAVNFSYYKFFYEYTGTKTADKTWTITDPVTLVEPGQTLVVWLTNNGNTVDDFNTYYGTDLVLGKNIAIVNYAGFHESQCRTLKFGLTADDIFARATFNEGNKATIDRTGNQSIQYTYPRTSDGRSTIVSTDMKPSPGVVENWQIPGNLISFAGYQNYPDDNGDAPNMKLHEECPESIKEGDELNVTFDVSDSMGIIGTRLYYRLDDEMKWNVITETKRRVSYYYFANIPANMLFGHDSVEFYVEIYNNYRGTRGENYRVKINRINDFKDIRLSVNDKSVINGIKTITANDGLDNKQVKLYLDDEKVDSVPMLENGAYFGLLAADRDSYFKNVVTAPYLENEREIIAYLVKWAADSDKKLIPIDSKFFKYNKQNNTYEIVLSVWAGDSGTPFEDLYIPEENHEDYTVSQLKLQLPNGKEYLPVKIGPDDKETKAKTNLSTDYNASHKIGDSAGMCTRMDVAFEIPADDVTAVGFQLDTTAMSDGIHTLKAESGEKQISTTFTIDNTKPSIKLGIEDKEQITGNVYIDPSITDEYGIAKKSILLDGEEIEVPYSKLARKMKEGSHTLTAIAEDYAGNVEQKNVTFEINRVNPVISSISTENIGNHTATLKVELEKNNSEEAKISYYKGKTLTVEEGDITVYSGKGDEPLKMDYESQETQITAPDGEWPYFVYRIRTGKIEEDDSVFVNWDGTANYADEAHAVKMYVLNREKNKWNVIGMPDENGSITASFKAKDTILNGEAIVLVQCRAELSEPGTKQGDKITTQNILQNSSWDGTNRPEKYDFALAWITDTQYYCESYPEHYYSQNEWIVDHAKEWKIPYVIHTGDIVDEFDMIDQWERADRAMKIFEDAGIPYGVLAGNHDVAAGRMQYQNYWKYFGKSRFKNMPCYGGNYRNNAGHYDLISQNGQDLLLLYMSWDIYTDEINWMNEVLAKYPERKAIILLHRYTNVTEKDGTYLDYAGKVLKEQVVKKNKNVIAVLNGHYHGSSFETTSFDDDGDGVRERTVYQICTDYQSAKEGGVEYIKFLYFDIAGNKIYMNSYSPMLDDFNFYDTPKYENYEDGAKGTNIDIFELNVNFDKREKTLTCNQFSAGVRSQQKIGGADLNDLKAQITWNGLQDDTRYTWYVAAENEKGGLVYSDLISFRTAQKTIDTKTDIFLKTEDKKENIVSALSHDFEKTGVERQNIEKEIILETQVPLVSGIPNEKTKVSSQKKKQGTQADELQEKPESVEKNIDIEDIDEIDTVEPDIAEEMTQDLLEEKQEKDKVDAVQEAVKSPVNPVVIILTILFVCIFAVIIFCFAVKKNSKQE